MNFLACGPGRPVVSRMNKVDVWVPVKFVLLRSLVHKPWFCAGCRDQGRTVREGATMETSKYVTESLRLKTRSIRACSVCQLTTRVRAGTSCSMNTLTPLWD